MGITIAYVSVALVLNIALGSTAPRSNTSKTSCRILLARTEPEQGISGSFKAVETQPRVQV